MLISSRIRTCWFWTLEHLLYFDLVYQVFWFCQIIKWDTNSWYLAYDAVSPWSRGFLPVLHSAWIFQRVIVYYSHIQRWGVGRCSLQSVLPMTSSVMSCAVHQIRWTILRFSSLPLFRSLRCWHKNRTQCIHNRLTLGYPMGRPEVGMPVLTRQ